MCNFCSVMFLSFGFYHVSVSIFVFIKEINTGNILETCCLTRHDIYPKQNSTTCVTNIPSQVHIRSTITKRQKEKTKEYYKCIKLIHQSLKVFVNIPFDGVSVSNCLNILSFHRSTWTILPLRQNVKLFQNYPLRIFR